MIEHVGRITVLSICFFLLSSWLVILMRLMAFIMSTRDVKYLYSGWSNLNHNICPISIVICMFYCVMCIMRIALF